MDSKSKNRLELENVTLLTIAVNFCLNHFDAFLVSDERANLR